MAGDEAAGRDHVKPLDGRLHLDGELSVFVIYGAEDENMPVQWLEETIPIFRGHDACMDTVRTLSQNKQWNMYAVLEAMRNTPTDQIYQEQLDSLIAQQDSLLSTPHIRRKDHYAP